MVVLIAIVLIAERQPAGNHSSASISNQAAGSGEQAESETAAGTAGTANTASNKQSQDDDYYVENPNAYVDKSWRDIGDAALNALNGIDYDDDIPDMPYGQCTGYVAWAMVNLYGIPEYPHSFSSEDMRNGGEYVDAHRMWLMENADFVGYATTETGQVTYHGGNYRPGDIIIFNNQRDCSEGTLQEGNLNPFTDYWGEAGNAFFTHIAIVGSDTTEWNENLEDGTYWETGKQLPKGQYNLHHSTFSLTHGICNILSPEQFISRDVPEDNMDYSRSYEIYRLLR